MLSIRKPRRDPVRGQDLVRDLTLTAEMLGMLEACVRARLNILISGGLGAGKTTLLDALGRGEAGMRQLVFHGLLMHPDCVVVDELLGGLRRWPGWGMGMRGCIRLPSGCSRPRPSRCWCTLRAFGMEPGGSAT
jgi:stage III sporulation protein SpoIIIAA